MHEHPFLSRASHSIVFGGKCALVFGVALYASLFAAILMVRADGTAPVVTHISAGIIDFTMGLLNASSGGAVFPVVVFWSTVVFAACFLIALIFSGAQSIPTDQAAWPWSLGIILIVAGAVQFLVRNHQDRDEPVDEQALALEFVRHNAEVMQAVGGNGEVSPLGYVGGQNQPSRYEFAVYGAKTLYAFVEVSESPSAPRVKLLCTTPLEFGQRDPLKHPCEQE